MFDALGRELSSAILANGIEQTRTDTFYLPDGPVRETCSWDRVITDSNPLGTTNAVGSREFRWHDVKGRVVATARLGSRGASGTYTNESAPVPWSASLDPRSSDVNGNLASLHVSPALAGARITAYQYDDKGQRTRMLDSSGLLTRSFYDNLGQLTETREQSQSTFSPRTTRRTCYAYDKGRLKKIAAVFLDPTLQVSWESASYSAQITQVDYDDGDGAGAEIRDAQTGNVISHSFGLPRSVRFPDPATGLPKADPDFVFTYYADGSIASRRDAREILLSYTYDDSGNHVKTQIDESAFRAHYPSGWAFPPDTITQVDNTYSSLGELLSSIAKSGATVIGTNSFTYDRRGNLLADVQAHGGGSTGRIDYTWGFSTTENFDRLTSMLYPQRAGTTSRREVTLDYGSSTSAVDSRLGRITRIGEHVSSGTQPPPFSAYEYSGAGKRVKMRLGGEMGSSSYAAACDLVPATTPGYVSLDSQGRLADLHYTTSAGATIHRYQHGYDLMDNLLYARTTQGTHVNDRSYLYGYDAFQRLTSAKLGTLNSSNTAIETGTTPRLTTWNLDIVGNWSGDSGTSLPGHVVENPSGSGSSTISTTQSVFFDNQIDTVSRQVGAGTPTVTAYEYDRAGNLVSDGTYFYQYDGLSRLVHVAPIGNVTFSPSGEPGVPTGSGTPGPWILQYTYDGLGRIIRKLSPWPGMSQLQRTEHYYYDGIRRIAEVFTDPLFKTTDNGPVPISDEPGATPQQYTTWTDREHVWGPAAVDELVTQVYSNNARNYCIVDSGGSVTGVVSTNGAIAEQYALDPYGIVLAKDTYAEPRNRIGHKGLFINRLDAGITSPQMGIDSLTLVENRNRTCSTSAARYLQADPDRRGQPLVAMAQNGNAPDQAFGAFVITPGSVSHPYEYLGSRPIAAADELGLFIDLLLPSTTLDIETDWMDNVVSTGQSMGEMVRRVFDGAAFDQMSDALWALNWDRADDDYSRVVAPPTTNGQGSFDAGLVLSRIRGHHIATNKNFKAGNRWSVQFKSIFDRAGMSMNNKANLLVLDDELLRTVHRTRAAGGRTFHADSYHRWVYGELRRAVGNKEGQEAFEALERALTRIKEELRRNPYRLIGQ